MSDDTQPTAQVKEHVAHLRQGRKVLVRAVRPDDRSEFEEAFARLSPESRYTRFFLPMRELPPKMLDVAANPPADQSMAIVAVIDVGAEIDIVGGARIHFMPGQDVCEFAVTVADDWQGVGLARHLMETIVEAARARGLRRMEGFVLPGNTGMRKLAERLGFKDEVCPDDRSLRLVSLDLG
jgi:RimJ/RimL family protein N-acetyltransferase